MNTLKIEIDVEEGVPISIYATGDHIDDLRTSAKYTADEANFYALDELTVRNYNRAVEALTKAIAEAQ